jgi:hypothetical protein
MFAGRIFEVVREHTNMFKDDLWMVLSAGKDEVGVKQNEGELVATCVLLDGDFPAIEFPATLLDRFQDLLYPCGDTPCLFAEDAPVHPQAAIYHLIDDSALLEGFSDTYGSTHAYLVHLLGDYDDRGTESGHAAAGSAHPQ